MAGLTLSIVIPVYKNEGSIPDLLHHLNQIVPKVKGRLEVVFVVDGSPDQSYSILKEKLPTCQFSSQLILLSRNFGSFCAIRAGLEVAQGAHFAVIAADLQEPMELPLQFFESLTADECDVVLGVRNRRQDPWTTTLASRLFWTIYRTLVQKNMPRGGVDVFGCNLIVRNQILALRESNTTLVGLLLWLGFRKKMVGYDRLVRRHGKSSWSISRKIRYLLDSSFAFSDLPIRILSIIGICGLSLSFVFVLIILFSKLVGKIDVPGYAAETTLILFFGGLNSFGLGILGEYLWRTFENTKGRPNYIIFKQDKFKQ